MDSAPPLLASLLAATDAAARERAWADFVAEYSRLILHVAHSRPGDRDAAMDRYVYVLDALRRDDLQRLRAFAVEGRGRFTTWLVAVVRRLCIDEHRHHYGRPQGDGATEWQGRRRDLVDLVGADVELDAIAASTAAPDEELLRAELRDALARALARLDPSERLLLRLRHEDGLSVPEIARLVGAPSPFHLYRRLDQLRRALRGALQAEGIELPGL